MSLPYYGALYFGFMVINVKYGAFYPYAYKIICPHCYCLNRPKDSCAFEKENYLASFYVKTDTDIFRFNRTDPACIDGFGRLRFGSGKRHCKYCGGDILTPGLYFTLICIFGSVNIKENPSTIKLVDPDITGRKNPLYLSELHIDAGSTDPIKLEKFITFVMNHPAKGNPENLPVYYYGDLAALGDHMKNLLHNTFNKLEQKGPPYKEEVR